MLSDVTFARIHAFPFCGRLALNRKCFLPRRDLGAVLHQFFLLNLCKYLVLRPFSLEKFANAPKNIFDFVVDLDS